MGPRKGERLISGIRSLDKRNETDGVEFIDSAQKRVDNVAADRFPALLIIGRTEPNRRHDRLLGLATDQIPDYTGCPTLMVAERGIAP